jgi:hypothetical protein
MQKYLPKTLNQPSSRNPKSISVGQAAFARRENDMKDPAINEIVDIIIFG